MNLGPIQIAKVRETSAHEPEPEPDSEYLDDPSKQRHEKRWKEVGRTIVESNYYEILVVVLTFIALFMEDAETLILTSRSHRTEDYDAIVLEVFSVMRLTAFIVFLLDLIVGSMFKLNYNCKLVWWLDFVSAISMLPLENFNVSSDEGLSLNYLVALKAFKVARATRLLKMLRVVRLAKVVRLLRVINLGKKKVADTTFTIGDEEERNEGDQLNADHLREQLTTMITVKVLLMILLLMFGLPIIALFLGDACYNMEKTTTLVIKGMEQLHIMFSNTQFYNNRRQCEIDPFCRAGIGKFHQVLQPYADLYVSNITLAGNQWCDVSTPDCPVVSAMGLSRKFFTDVCFVLDQNYQRVNCAGCEYMGSCCPDCAVCAPCFAGSNLTSDVYSFTMDVTKIERTEAVNSMLQVVLLVAVLLTCVFIFRRDAGHISKALGVPVKVLAKDMERVSHMSFQPTQKTESSFYEIAKIGKSFAVMKGTLQSFAKFVPREFVRYLIMKGQDARLSMQYCELTIFFSDIASFTTICESLGSKQLYLLLSSYFDEMSKIIMESDGTLIEYIGDAILAIWNAPMTDEDHACLGVCSTLLMQERLHALRLHWSATVFNTRESNSPNSPKSPQARSMPDFQVRCGLHTAGSFVGNMGSPARMKYGVAGACMATAGMLEELNKTYDTRILISEKTFHHSSVKEKVLCRMVDYAWVEEDEAPSETKADEEKNNETMVIEMRLDEITGSRKVMAVYEPLCLRDEGDADDATVIISQLHDKAFTFYRQRLFSQAADTFAQAKHLCEQDPSLCISPKAAAVLQKRCLQFITTPPPSDWNMAPGQS